LGISHPCPAQVERLAVFGLRAQARHKWSLHLSVAPFGHGFIVDARFILSEALGAVLASGLLIPVAAAREGDWYAAGAAGFEGLEAYYYVPAIFAIAFDAVYQVLRLAARLRPRRKPRDDDGGGGDLGAALLGGAAAPAAWRPPTRAWVAAWAAASLVALVALPPLFGCSYAMTAVALLAAPLWSLGITVAVGTTGSNVASSCGKVMIILFAAWYGEPRVVPVLALGALSTAVIDQALDLVRDFKTAHLVGAPPKAVFAAQCVGAAASVFSAAVLYAWYVDRVPLPSADLPCVIAKSYRGLAFAFAGGLGALPRHCLALSAATGAAAVGFDVARDLAPARVEPMIPSGIAFGVGLILLSGQVFCSLLGLGVFAAWGRVAPEHRDRRAQLFGAALLAGDGVAGVLQSVLEASGVQPPWVFAYPAWWPA